jgi:aldoxime dehydratase
MATKSLERTQPKRTPPDWAPPFPAWSAVFGDKIKQVVMAYFGVQSKTGEEKPASDEIAVYLGRGEAPDHVDRAHYIDEAGYSTTILIGYWLDPTRYEAWTASSGFAAWWAARDQVDDQLGYFIEVIAPDHDRFETLFSSPSFTHGITSAAEGFGEPIVEHGYWGGMRDRLPIAAIDPLGAGKEFSVAKDGKRVRVTPGENLCLIRSGQRYGATEGIEREIYLDEVEPALRAGMDYLRDNGHEIGCIATRYMMELGADGSAQEVTFGMSWFKSLGHLESWSAHHPTHLHIFGTFLKMAQKLGPAMKLELWHEVSVLPSAGQVFEYVNCHPMTGLLKLA